MDGKEHTMDGDYIISSMPVKDLVAGMNDVPADPARIAKGLPYRDYMTLGVLVPKIKLENKTNILTNKTKIKFDIGIDDRPKNLNSCNRKLLYTEFRNEKIMGEELQKDNITRVNNWLEIQQKLLNVD